MAFCSGSSFSTDRWTRRKGLPSSDQLLKVGNASLLHQYSSSKPTAHSGSASATLISRSRRLFSFVQGIGRGDPAFGSLPTHPHPLKGGPDALSRNSLFGKPLLEAHLKAAISSVQRLLSRPNSLGERWSSSLKASAPCLSKTARVRLGREDLPARASRPLSLKSWIASRTV